MELAVAGQVAEPDRTGIPAPPSGLVFEDPLQRQVTGNACHGRGGMERPHHIQHVGSHRRDGVDRGGQVLDSGKFHHPDRCARLDREAPLLQASGDVGVYVALFLQFLGVVQEAVCEPPVLSGSGAPRSGAGQSQGRHLDPVDPRQQFRRCSAEDRSIRASEGRTPHCRGGCGVERRGKARIGTMPHIETAGENHLAESSLPTALRGRRLESGCPGRVHRRARVATADPFDRRRRMIQEALVAEVDRVGGRVVDDFRSDRSQVLARAVSIRSTNSLATVAGSSPPLTSVAATHTLWSPRRRIRASAGSTSRTEGNCGHALLGSKEKPPISIGARSALSRAT